MKNVHDEAFISDRAEVGHSNLIPASENGAATVRDMIDDNIDDLKGRIERQAKSIKTLLREALSHYRSQGTKTENSLSPTRL